MSYYEFDVFQFDIPTKVLTVSGRPVPLPPKATELLLVFLSEPKKLLLKKDLHDKIWPDTFVEEANVTFQVAALREALGKISKGKEFIQTVHGRGYRFIVDVIEQSLLAIDVRELPSPVLSMASSEQLDSENPAPWKSNESFISLWKRDSIPAYVIPTAVVALVALTVAAVFKSRLSAPSNLSVTQYNQLTTDGQDKALQPLLSDGLRLYFKERTPNGDAFASVSTHGSQTWPIRLPFGDENIYDLRPATSELLVGKSTSDDPDPELWVVPLLGPPPRPVAGLRADSAAWSPDGSRIAFTLKNSVSIANSDGSENRKIAEVPGHAFAPHWSPNARKIRFSESWQQGGSILTEIWEVRSDGSDLRRLLHSWKNPHHECCGVWTPDGKFYVFQSESKGRRDLWTIAEHQGFLGTTSGVPQQLTSTNQDFDTPAIDPKANRIYAIGTYPRGELVRYDENLKEFIPFLGGISATWVCFSKSGDSVAYIDYTSHSVWRANADGSEKLQITFPPFDADGLAWSPDGKTLAVHGRSPGEVFGIYTVPSEGGRRTPLMTNTIDQGIPTWSSDGKRIAFGDIPSKFGKPTGREVIHIFDLSTKATETLSGSQELWSARWAPDGRTLSALSIVGQNLTLYDFATKKWRPTAAKSVNNPTWSRDSKYIYFDTEGDKRELHRLRVADGHVDSLVNLHGLSNLAWWWSGVTPDNSPMILRNVGGTEIYSLALEHRDGSN